MKKYNFARGMWDPAELPMTYTLMCRDYATVRQEDDCIAAGFNEKIGAFDYIGVGMTEPICGDCTVTARCSFEDHGAPLIDLADGIRLDSEGRRICDALHEIVVWPNGCNIWRILPQEDPARPEKRYSVSPVASEEFHVPADSMVELEVRVEGKHLFVRVNDYCFDVEAPELPDEYYVGATLCEGVARLYELTVEQA